MGTASVARTRLPRGGIVLAGGRSSRMGRPKPLVRVGDAPMIARVARALEGTCDELVVVTGARPDDAARCGEDSLREALADSAFAARTGALRFSRDGAADLGPVAGIAAGLETSRADLVLIVACDLPFLSAGLVRGLFEAAESSLPTDVVAARRDGFWEPMPAVMRRETMKRVYGGQLARGDLRPTASWPGLRVVAVEGAALARLDPDGASFLGVNDPIDLARAQARLERGGP